MDLLYCLGASVVFLRLPVLLPQINHVLRTGLAHALEKIVVSTYKNHKSESTGKFWHVHNGLHAFEVGVHSGLGFASWIVEVGSHSLEQAR
jgi:hypothetical protein